jgi:nitroreductase
MEIQEILSNLQRRYACKIFDSERKIPDKDVVNIIQALRLTPSSFGLQPWKYIIVSDQTLKQKLMAATHQEQIISCSHLIILCGINDIDSDYVDRRYQYSLDAGWDPQRLSKYNEMILTMASDLKSKGMLQTYIDNQVYIALWSLIQICANLHIDACPMWGFDKQAYDDILGLTNDGWHSVVICPIGYRSPEDSAQHRKKIRRSYDDVCRVV